LPLHGVGAVSVSPYEFRSGMGTCFTLAIDYYSGSAEMWEQAKRMLEQYRAIRHLFMGDFYPLTPYSVANDVWMAWQFDRPDSGEGMVQAFRRADSIYESARFRLKALDPEARYLVSDVDLAGASEITGRELMEKGLLVSLPQQPSAAVIVYRQVGPSR